MTDLLGGLVPSVLLIGVLLIARRALGTRSVSRTAGRIRVVERTGVTRGAAVAVVEVDHRKFLIGATEHGVSLLSELDTSPPDAVAAPDRETPAHPGWSLPIHPGQSLPAHPAGLMDDQAGSSAVDRPRSGLVHRLQRMTVRTHLEAPLRALD